MLVYELVTGELPFDGRASEIGEAKPAGKPTTLSEVADVPLTVDEALEPALEPEKSARHEGKIVYFRDKLTALFEAYHTGASRAGSAAGVTESDTNPVTGTDDGTGTAVDAGPDGPTASDATAVGTSRVDDERATDTTGRQLGRDERGDDGQTMQSWDEYRRELGQQEDQFLYSVLPGSLRRLFYSELVTELGRAES